MAFFADGNDIASRLDALCHFYSVPLAERVFLRNDRVAVIGNGTTRHQTNGLTGQYRVFVNDAGADRGDDVIAFFFMTAKGIYGTADRDGRP